MRNLRSLRAQPVLALALLLTGTTTAQERGQPKPAKQEEGPKVDMLEGMGMGSDQEKMIELFHEVERALAAIDVELADAGAGVIPLPESKDGGIDRLLRSTTEKSDQAVAGIDEILALAAKMGGKSSGSCMKTSMQPGQGKPGESPLDKQKNQGPTQGEKTPEAPKGEKPGPDPQKPQPNPEGDKPDDGGKNPPAGENRPAPPRQDSGGPAVAPGQDAERWGTLPERVQAVLKNQITDDMPPQYRDWIDAYYRRLNKVR